MKKIYLLILLLLALPIGMQAQGSTWQSATFINSGSSGSSTLDDKNTEVYYKIDVPEEGSVKITMTCDGDLKINWVDCCWYRAADGKYESRKSTGWYPESGNTLEITNAGKGVYYLRAQRRSGSGTLTLNYQFTACSYANDVTDNDTAGTGTLLKDGVAAQGRLGYRDATNNLDSQDWYKIEVPQDGRIDIEYSFDQTYELRLNFIDCCRYRAADGAYPNRKGTGWYPEASGTLTLTDVGKGTYYIHMEHRDGHGGYTLRYVFTPNDYTNDPEPNDDLKGQVGEIANGQTVQGHLGYLDGSDYCDKHDWWKIEVPEDGRIDLIYNFDQTYELRLNFIDCCWYRAADDKYPNRQGTGWYPEASGTLTLTNVGKGTYYIHMERRDGHGGYTLKYVFTPNKYANDPEPNDDLKGQVGEIANGQTVQGHLGYCDATNYTDVHDWWKIEVPKDGRIDLIYNIEQTNELRLNFIDCCWYRAADDAYPNRQGTGWYPEASDTLTLTDVGKGFYYIHMERRDGHGGYTLKYVFTPNSYANDTEPNNEIGEVTQVIPIDGTVGGHLGYRDGNNIMDDDDWIKLDTKDAAAMMNVTINTDSTSTLRFNWIVIVRQEGDQTKNVVSTGWYPEGSSITLTNSDIDPNANYYVHLQRRDGHGGYTVTYGAPTRFDGSDIRVSCIGRGTTRRGIPSRMDVKVENIGSSHTGSFFIALPATPDIQFLSAYIPTEDGVIEIDREEFAFYDSEEGDCAVFIMPNLGPFESYTFTIYTQGIVSNAARNRVAPPDKEKVYAGAMKYSEKKSFGDNFSWQAMAEDGTSVALVDALVDTGIFPESKARAYAQAIGEADHGYRSSYRAPVANPIMHYTTKVIQQANPVMAIPNALVASGKMANALVTGLRRRLWYWIYKEIGLIKEEPQVMDADKGVNGIVSSWDPNEMVGPMGFSDEHYIAETKTMEYRILFENKAEATDNAYRIIIDDELDENIFDVSTVRFGATSHEGMAYNWKMNRNGNKLKWEIEGIELPPNKNAPEGEGYVTFSVDLKPGLESGTQIKNKAAIKFDYNEIIETNEYVNTLDLEAPVTQMKNVSKQGDGKFLITCKGNDKESGISHYMFYASTDGSDYKYIGQNNEPNISFAAQGDVNFSIVAFAVDNVGNSQKTAPEAIMFNPTKMAIPGDTNGDGEVNVADVDYVIEAIGEDFETYKDADANGDGEINVADVDFIIERIE